jgi:hypothetical protein
MDAERWRKIEQQYHAALEPEAGGGPHFCNRLAPATLCAGSSTLFIVPDWKLHVLSLASLTDPEG